METILPFVGCLFLAYLLGSIPFGKIVGLRMGIDIQKKGSGNIGFANSVRVLGWKAGIIVLVGDVLKGFLPSLLAVHVLSFQQALVVGLVAILAHIFPIWLKFKGGKGIATGLGITLAIQPLVGLCGFAMYIAVYLVAKKSAPSSVLAAWSLILFSLLFAPRYAGFALILALLATWTHRTNLQKHLKARRA